MSNDYTEILSKVCQICYRGALPVADDENFVDAVMTVLRPTVLAGQPPAVVDAFRHGLREALLDLRAAEAVERAAQWTN